METYSIGEDSLVKGMHIYDRSKLTTLCGEENDPNSLVNGMVWSDQRDLMIFSHRFSQPGKLVFIGTGYYLHGVQGNVFHLCKECYAMHVLVAA